MTIDRTLAIASRIINQIARDHRSLALIIVAPVIVMSLVGFSFADQQPILDQVAPGLIGAFVLFFVFILTGVSFLRERSQGTLERLLTTPVGRADILAGYLLGFLPFAGIQSLVILLYTIFALRIDYEGYLWQIFVLLVVVTIMAVNLGIFISTFARNEFQVVQFIPVILLPQIFLSGAVLPFEQLPGYFQGRWPVSTAHLRRGRPEGHHAPRRDPVGYRPGDSRTRRVRNRAISPRRHHPAPPLTRSALARYLAQRSGPGRP